MNNVKRDKGGKAKAEEANVTTEVKVRNKFFYFDTACISHISPGAERLLNYLKRSGFVKSSSQMSVEILGKGDVILDCILGDRSGSSFGVQDVWRIPDVAHSLIP